MRIEEDGHVSDDALESYALGHLTDENVFLLEDHLLVCPKCQDHLAQVDAFVIAMKKACAEPQFERKPLRQTSFSFFTWHRPVWAVMLATAVLSVVALSTWRGPADHIGRVVTLESARGNDGDTVAHVIATNALEFRVNVAQLPPQSVYELEIVNADGRRVWRGTASSDKAQIHVPVKDSLRRGHYWVRLYGSSSAELLREFGLRVD